MLATVCWCGHRFVAYYSAVTLLSDVWVCSGALTGQSQQATTNQAAVRSGGLSVGSVKLDTFANLHKPSRRRATARPARGGEKEQIECRKQTVLRGISRGDLQHELSGSESGIRHGQAPHSDSGEPGVPGVGRQGQVQGARLLT